MMLVLTREVGESINIGDDIVVTISTIERGRVRVAISAPRDVPIVRREISDAELRREAQFCRIPSMAATHAATVNTLDFGSREVHPVLEQTPPE